jgi:hypothetical protein
LCEKLNIAHRKIAAIAAAYLVEQILHGVVDSDLPSADGMLEGNILLLFSFAN